MKKLIFFFALTFFATTSQAQKITATVNQENGFYIFTDCKPNNDYQTIEIFRAKKVNMDLVSKEATGLSYDELKQDIFEQISKAKKKGKLTGATAIIFYPDQQKAEIVTLK